MRVVNAAARFVCCGACNRLGRLVLGALGATVDTGRYVSLVTYVRSLRSRTYWLLPTAAYCADVRPCCPPAPLGGGSGSSATVTVPL